jgi:transcriptional regulator with XRE-family HTH domain
MNFGHAIKTARMCANWSVEELAENAGLSASEIFRMESGEIDVSPEAEQAIAKAFDISTWSFEKLAEDEEGEFKQVTRTQIAMIKAALAIRHFPKRQEKKSSLYLSQ